MWEEILRLAVGNGLWAVLFCALLVHILRDSKKREEKYVEIITGLNERLKVVSEIKDNTEKIIKQTAKKKREEAASCVVSAA